MKNKKAIVFMWVLALVPVVLVLACLPTLPSQVPMQWGLDGAVRYGDKREMLLMTLLSPALALLFQFLPRFDPRKRNYEKFQGWYDLLGVALPLFLLAVISMVLVESYRPGTVVVFRVIGVLLGALLLFLGNMMGKVKSTFFVGFRTPWSLSDPDVWNRTQRMGGFVFFFTGLVAVVLGLFAPEKVFFWVFFLLLFGGVGATFFMSWKWYQGKDKFTC